MDFFGGKQGKYRHKFPEPRVAALYEGGSWGLKGHRGNFDVEPLSKPDPGAGVSESIGSGNF